MILAQANRVRQLVQRVGGTLAAWVREGVSQTDLVGMRFNTIGVSDGMSMGTEGMSYSLQSRDLIADSIETVMGAQWYDALIALPGCDKNMPGCLLAMGRDVEAMADGEAGRWEVTLDARDADATPRKLTVASGDENIEMDNIVIGDVWVMNGQSNMAFALGKTDQADLCPVKSQPQHQENRDEALRGQGKSRKKHSKPSAKESKARQGLSQIQKLYALERTLVEDHDVAEVVRLRKANYSAPAEARIMDRAPRRDAGIGD